MYDVIIIGAGPAGGMCAQELSRKGYSVILIDSKKEIGKPVQCGEAISEYCLENMGLSLEKKWFKIKLRGVKCVLPNKKSFYTTVKSLSINRAVFDSWLVEKAIDKGAELKTNTKAKKICGKPGNWEIQTTNCIIKSKIIIGSDGPLSHTARNLGLLKRRKYLKAFQFKFNAKDLTLEENDWLHMFWDEKYHGGYGWVFPRGDEYNVGVGGYDIDISYLHSFCKKLGVFWSKKIGASGGLIPVDFQFISRAKEGVIIVGDAAATINPVTGGGIHAALFSGKIGAKITNEALKNEDLTYMLNYDSLINKSVFLNPIHKRVANFFKNWTNKEWNFLGKAADGMDMNDLTLFKSFKIGLKYPRYILRGRELLTIRKEMSLNKLCM